MRACFGMQIIPIYRHEYKYLISTGQIPLIQSLLSGLMRPDPHAGGKKFYTVRSVYFDNYRNQCFFDNEDGNDPRQKYRIRIYNSSADCIRLECKQKIRGKTAKRSCTLQLGQALSLLGGLPAEGGSPHPLLHDLNMKIRAELYRPVVIVEYLRIPYISPLGNTRITIDMQLSSSDQIEDFFQDIPIRRPVMPVGQDLLEVKFDDFLPDPIYHSLNMGTLQRTAYSKYYLCRKYSLKGGL